DLDLRGPGRRPRHARHRTAHVVQAHSRPAEGSIGPTGHFRRPPGKAVRPDGGIASDAFRGRGLPAWDWDFELDGALALQPDARSVTVPPMSPPPAHALAVRRKRAENAAARRKRRLVGLLLLAAVALVTLLLTAFGSGGRARVATTAPAPATRLLPSG